MGAGPGGPQDVTRAPKRHADGRTDRRRCTFFQGESLQLSLPPRVLGPWLGHCAGPLPALSVDQGINGCSVLGGKAFRPGWGEGVSCREAGSSPAVRKTLKASLLPLCWEVDVQCWIESWGLWGGAGAGEAAGVGGEEWGS